MTRPRAGGWGILAAAVLLLAGCCCTGSRYLEPGAFVNQAQEVLANQDTRETVMVGTHGTRAYLEYFTRSGQSGETHLYWTELDRLPPTVADPLRSGRNPWAENRKP